LYEQVAQTGNYVLEVKVQKVRLFLLQQARKLRSLPLEEENHKTGRSSESDDYTICSNSVNSLQNGFLEVLFFLMNIKCFFSA
jgi:hypothetical protein